MSAHTMPTPGWLAQWWQRLYTVILSLQLGSIARVRRRAALDLHFAGQTRLLAQQEYADRIQCLDSRQERLLAKLATAQALQHSSAPAGVAALLRVSKSVSRQIEDIEGQRREVLVQREVAALRRVAAFQERFCIHSPEQPTYFYSIRRDGDSLLLEVDFFSQRMCGQDAPVSLWAPVLDDMRHACVMNQDEILQVYVTPVSKAGFKEAHRAARILLADQTYWIDGKAMNRDMFFVLARTAAAKQCAVGPMRMRADVSGRFTQPRLSPRSPRGEPWHMN